MGTTHNKMYQRHAEHVKKEELKWYEKVILALGLLLLAWIISTPQEEIGAAFDKVFGLKPQVEYAIPVPQQQPETSRPLWEDKFPEGTQAV